MNVGITGSHGFIGWHLRCFLFTLKEDIEVRTANRETFADIQKLQEFAKDLDVVVHLAGVNRATDSDLIDGNLNSAGTELQRLSVDSVGLVDLAAQSLHVAEHQGRSVGDLYHFRLGVS